MIRRNLNGQRIVQAGSQNMKGQPTVVAAPQGGGNLPQLGTDPYISIEVDTSDAGITDPVKIVLFDAGRGYQLGTGYTMPLAVKITGLTANYQFIMNDIAHNSSYFDIVKQQIDTEAEALAQFGYPFEIFESSKGSSPRLVNTYYPQMGVHEGQYQKTINTFAAPMMITNRTAIVFTQRPGIKQVIGFYQKAEVGRHQ
jgi:hypothetical protein